MRKFMWIFSSSSQRRAAPRGGTLDVNLVGVLLLLLGVVCPLPIPTPASRAPSLFALGGRYEVREIKPHVFVWIPEDILDLDCDPEYSRAGNAGFIISPEGVVVVDTTNSPFHARELLFEIRRRSEAPVKCVIDTGAEGDCALGNEVFLDQEAAIISTPAALTELRRYQQQLPRRLEADWRLQTRMRGIHPTVPNQTFEREMSLRVDGQEIKLASISPPSSTGDLMVYLPGAKVLFLGNLYVNGYFPRIGSRDVRRWVEIIRQVENWDVDTYVPGHGLPGDRKDLEEFRRFLEWLAGEVETRVKEGKTLDQVKNDLGSLESFHWRARELATADIEAVFRQVAAAITADITR